MHVVPLVGEHGLAHCGREARMWPPTGVRGTTEVRSPDKCCLAVLWSGERGRSGACQGWREGSRRFHFCRSRVSHGLIVFGSRKLDIISGEHFLSRKEGLIHFAHFPTCRRGFLRGKHCCVDSMSVCSAGVCESSGCPWGLTRRREGG